MTNKNSGDSGGPAFPLYCPITQEHVSYTGYTNHDFTMGMTLRDYFAAKAMAAVMPAVMNELKKTRGSVKEAQRLQALSAETCYVLADAMLEARNG
jgi:hypothetical protein